MARIRMIKPEFFDDPHVADLSAYARLFFIGLWMQADRAGRLVDDPRRLKARIFPYDDVDIEALTVELHGKDMIRRYQDAEKHGYIWIRTFEKHQRPHPKEPPSVIPPWTDGAAKRHGEPCKKTEGTSESGSLVHGIRNLENETRAPKSVARATGDTNPAERVMDVFRDSWQRAYGYQSSLLPNSLEDMKLQLHLSEHSEPQLLEALAAYFRTDDDFVRRAKHPLGLFLRDPMKYLAKTARVPARSAPPRGCQHQPPCVDDAAHTSRQMSERKVVA